MTLVISALWSARSRLVGRRSLSPILHLASPTHNLATPLLHPPSSSEPGLAAYRRNVSTKSTKDDAQRPQPEENKVRNARFRRAFRLKDEPTAAQLVKQKLKSPFVPPVRDYPSQACSEQSAEEARVVARTLVGLDTAWENYVHEKHYIRKEIDWLELMRLLKRMTPKKSEQPQMAAVRIVLPHSWDLDIDNRRVEFVDNATGLLARLRVSVDQKNDSAIVLRGHRAMLAKAADEIVEACRDVQVFQLGEVAAFDYEAKRLWPSIDNAPDGGATVPENQLDSIWVHREHRTYWIDTRYEDVPRPDTWTTESFEAYITSMACGQLRSHLVVPLYREESLKKGRHPQMIDSDGIRVGLIMDAFMDPAARPHISPHALKTAIAFMAQRGGHRAAADQLFKHAEGLGIPMDTDMYNIMLEGYVTKRDVRFFYKLLRKMQNRYFHPDVRTWLLFLQLVEKDDQRRQIIVAMYSLGFFDDVGSRRNIARVMASHDAYVAFRSGKKLEHFMAGQTERYKADWFTREALNKVLKEYFRFHPNAKPADFVDLMEKQPDDGRGVDIRTINLVLEHCVAQKDWETTLWALERLASYGCKANDETYSQLMYLALDTSSPHALGVIFFYAAMERQLRTKPRHLMTLALTGRHWNKFWWRRTPYMFDNAMVRLMEAWANHAHWTSRQSTRSVNTSYKAILSVCGDKVPEEPLVKPLRAAALWRDSEEFGKGDHMPKGQPIKLYDPKDPTQKSTVVLNRVFKSSTMSPTRDALKTSEDDDSPEKTTQN